MKPTRKASKTRASEKLRATAYHEAGHAVAHYFLPKSRKIRHATIVPEQDSLGHVMSHRAPTLGRDDWRPPRMERIVDEIVCALAGTIAEKRATARYNHEGARSDREWAIDLAMKHLADGRQTEPCLRWLRIRTEVLIQRWWWAVEAVANALLERKTLKAKEINEVIVGEMNRQNMEQHGGPEGYEAWLATVAKAVDRAATDAHTSTDESVKHSGR